MIVDAFRRTHTDADARTHANARDHTVNANACGRMQTHTDANAQMQTQTDVTR